METSFLHPFFLTLFSLPLFFIFGPMIGLFSLFTNPFSQIFVMVNVLLFFFAWQGLKKHPRKNFKKEHLVFAIGSGFLLLWSSLFLSYAPLDDLGRTDQEIFEQNVPVAIGGFPFIAFQYPQPPMGSDVVPQSMWPLFFLDEAFWLVIGFFMTTRLSQKIKGDRRARIIFILTSVLTTLAGLGYLMLKFD